jgi:hypothetical protein
MPAFPETRSEKNSAKWKLEMGHFSLIKHSAVTRDMDEGDRRRQTWQPDVDDATKWKLVNEFTPLIRAGATQMARTYRLAYGRNDVKEQLVTAGVEGLLVAITKYKGGTAFNPDMVIRDYQRLEAAEMFMGYGLPQVHARNVARYMAARSQAQHRLELDRDPTPEEVLKFFDLRKRHLHKGLPVYDVTNKIGTYPKTMLRTVTLLSGQRVQRRVRHPQAGKPKYAKLRDAPVPDEPWRFPVHLGRKAKKGTVRKVSDRARPMQPSKLQWTEMYDGFLRGEHGIQEFETALLFPGAGLGRGVDEQEQAAIRHDVLTAAEAVTSLGPAVIELGKVTKTQSYRKKYRVKDLGEVILRRIGIGFDSPGGGESHTIHALVQTVPIYKQVGGKWQRVSDRLAHDLMDKFVRKGMKELRRKVVDRRATAFLKQAEQVVAPTERAPSGPSYWQVLKQEGAKFPQQQVVKFKAAKNLENLSDAEARIEMAHGTRRAKGLSREIRQAMTRTIDVERVSDTHGIAMIWNPETRAWHGVQVSMPKREELVEAAPSLSGVPIRPKVPLKDWPGGKRWLREGGSPEAVHESRAAGRIRKAFLSYHDEPALNSRILRDVARFPLTMRLVTTDSRPEGRMLVYRAMGLV